MSRASCAWVAAATVLAIAPSAAPAQSESRLSADVSATAGYSNNPFSILGTNTGSSLVTVDIAPRYQLLTARSIFTLSADVNLQEYLRRYGFNDSYSGALDYLGRPSERLTTHARLDLSSAVLGSFSAYPLPTTAGTFAPSGGTADAGTAAAVIATTPNLVSPLLPITDVQLFGLRNRRSTGRVSGDIGLGLSARDSLTVAGYAEATRYQDLAAGDYEAYGGSVGYSHEVSDRLNLGLRGSVASYVYRAPLTDNRIYSIEATTSDRLNELWTVDGSLGASFVDGGGGRSTRSTSLSGNIDLCRRGQRSTMCLQAARQVSPTGLAGTQYVTSAGLNWSKQLEKRQIVSLGANYSKVGRDAALLIAGALPYQSEYVQATAGYSRPLGERLRFTASTNYRQLLGSGNAGRPKDFGGLVGLAYRLGDKR